MSENDQPPETEDGYVLPGKGLKDARLERRALKSRWNVREEWKQAMLKKVVKNGLDPATSTRDSNQCMRAVLAAEQQDFEKDRAELPILLEHTGPGGGPVKLEVEETIVRSRTEAAALSALERAGSIPGLNGVH